MSWLDDLLSARTSTEQESRRKQEQRRERMGRAFRDSDRMVTRLLKDLGRAYWSGKCIWRVNGYPPWNGFWEPNWRLEAPEFTSGEKYFSVALCETCEGSEVWYFKVGARDMEIATENISEYALKEALRKAFVAGPIY